MKRKTAKLIYGLILFGLAALTVAVACFVFLPVIPNTTAARQGFYEMTGLQPSEVSDIYYDCSADVFGDYEKYLRFTYPSEDWLERFLSQRSDLSPTSSLRGGAPRQDWWQSERMNHLSEFYERWYSFPCVSMAVDRQQRCVYLRHIKL